MAKPAMGHLSSHTHLATHRGRPALLGLAWDLVHAFAFQSGFLPT